MVTPALLHEPKCRVCRKPATFTVVAAWQDCTKHFCYDHYKEHKESEAVDALVASIQVPKAA